MPKAAIRLIFAPGRLPGAGAVFRSPASAGLAEHMSADDGTPSAAQVEAAAGGRATHPREPHTGGTAGRMNRLAKGGKSPEEITKELYMIALCREPTAGELAAATRHLKAGKDLRAAVEDLGWVLINSKEFLFRH